MITSDELTENLSPFELSLFLEKKLHEENHNLETLLNAGRGNPNWTAPTAKGQPFYKKFGQQSITILGWIRKCG